jgi:hypothetical protein
VEVVTSLDEERKRDLFRELREREHQFDYHNPLDRAGRDDILHCIRRIETRLHELGLQDYEDEFREWCRREAAAEAQRKQAWRERYYEKTGVVPHE